MQACSGEKNGVKEGIVYKAGHCSKRSGSGEKAESGSSGPDFPCDFKQVFRV